MAMVEKVPVTDICFIFLCLLPNLLTTLRLLTEAWSILNQIVKILRVLKECMGPTVGLY